MSVRYDILLQGSSAMLDVGYIGLTNITLIHAENGPILVDVGHGVNWQGLEKALADRGMTPRDVPKIFLSHLHHDHVLNLHKFPHAEVFVSRAEYDYAADPHPKDPFIPFMVREQVMTHKVNFLEGSGELTPGVKYLPAPGHTPGCVALVLDREDGGRTVVAQDAIKFPKEVLARRVNDAFDTPERATETIRHLLTLGDRIIPGHWCEMRREGDTFVWDDAMDFNLRFR